MADDSISQNDLVMPPIDSDSTSNAGRRTSVSPSRYQPAQHYLISNARSGSSSASPVPYNPQSPAAVLPSSAPRKIPRDSPIASLGDPSPSYRVPCPAAGPCS